MLGASRAVLRARGSVLGAKRGVLRVARYGVVAIVALGSQHPALSTVLYAQGSTRLATTAEALVASPVFFHGKQIVVRRDVEPAGSLLRLANTTKPVFVFWRDSPSAPRNGEVRGEFWDLGRLERTDSRFSSVNVQPILDAASNGQWPPRDQVFVILGASAVESPLPDDPNLRALALAPERYIGKGVTITGRFRGANLFADLPQGAGTKGRWDFVLQSADAAIWVSGVRPRGKGFDYDVNSRIDTGHWLKIAGTLRRDGALPWIEATSIAEATAPSETVAEVIVPPPPQPVPQVVFSTPTADETDAERAAPIRIQFSRDMDPRTFSGRVKVSYSGPAPADAPAMPTFSVRYNEGTRALEIKPAAPLDRFRTVKVDLLEGILSNIDNQPLAPYTLTFTTGG
jgi:Bacterial Ig-like domain